MRKYRRKVVIILAIIGGALLIALTSLYLGRNGILHRMVDKRTFQTGQKHGLSIHYKDLEMIGLNEITLQGLSIVPHQRDTLLTLQTLDVKLSFWKLLSGVIEVRNVKIDNLGVFFIKKDSIANYDFMFRQEKQKDQVEPGQADYAGRVNKILNLLYGFLPENGELNHLHITERKDTNFISVNIPSLAIKNNKFHSTIEVKEDTLTQYWITNGELNRGSNTLRAELYPQEKKRITLPYITRRIGAEVTFDTLAYSLTREKEEDENVILSGKARITGLHIFHKALSPEVVNLNSGQLAYKINVGTEFLELDSTSNVQFNKLQFHPYLRAEKKNKLWHFTASVNKPWFPADELFSSLPEGLFNNLEGIQTSGELSYHLLLDIDFSQLDSLTLESELKEKDFRIIKYGASDLRKMSGEFLYTAYENGQPVRTFPIGPSWEHFTPLDSISPLLQMSVMQSEDGAFYYHHGFLPDAMREALIHDLKVNKFARGGSTITMQLVKNVFLNRNKNFARKLEEALIVWLIETERLTPKARMYEVYLNIAEWGPLVYGAHEAAAYYFDKRPSQLSVEECIFLASIIPKPKRFRSSFTEDMKLKENMEGYYRLIAGRLAKKGMISEAEADSIRPDIKVTGQARNRLDSIKNSIKE